MHYHCRTSQMKSAMTIVNTTVKRTRSGFIALASFISNKLVAINIVIKHAFHTQSKSEGVHRRIGINSSLKLMRQN